VLDAMPKTESGKLNRPGLPRPAVSTSGHTEPSRTDTERALATRVLRLAVDPDVGRFRRLLRTRGDSILSVQLASRARAVGLPVNPRMIFENPTLRSWPPLWTRWKHRGTALRRTTEMTPVKLASSR